MREETRTKRRGTDNNKCLLVTLAFFPSLSSCFFSFLACRAEQRERGEVALSPCHDSEREDEGKEGKEGEKEKGGKSRS